MVPEQDFIMQVRRMHRTQEPHIVLNLMIDTGHGQESNVGLREALQEKLTGALPGCDVFAMTSGDVFLVIPMARAKGLDIAGGLQRALGNDLGKIAQRSYAMPADYMPLRERLNEYIDLARVIAAGGSVEQRAQQILSRDESAGILTAWTVAQIERLVQEVDIRRYTKTQPVYRRLAADRWDMIFEEYYISIGDLKRERFPRLNVETPERLFLDLCCTLDRCLLQEMTVRDTDWRGRGLSINLAVETILSSTFARFCHVLPASERHLIGFELHRTDLFQDFAASLSAINLLRSEGFRVALDGMTPDVLPYLSVDRFTVDFYKIAVSKHFAPLLRTPETMTALQKLPRDKILFFRCDNQEALKIGLDLGVEHYQGWLIDDLAHPS
jgi:hypothetical protein